MRKTWMLILLLLAGVLLAQTVTIMVKDTKVRSSPKFYASSIYSAKRGEQLTKVATQQDWYQVKTPAGKIGWVHASAVETKKLKLSSGQWVETEASPQEVALAGKGFNQEVETQYRQNHPDLDFTWVDRMERMEIPEGEMVAFLKEGKLGEYGGGQ
jgi:uncharacterized protein YgiM (DUF1202 family)